MVVNHSSILQLGLASSASCFFFGEMDNVSDENDVTIVATTSRRGPFPLESRAPIQGRLIGSCVFSVTKK